MPDITPLASASEVVAALGGTTAVVDLTDAKSPQVVTNWISRNRFASHTYLILTAALEERGFAADPLLWGITPAGEQTAAEAPQAAE